MAQCHVRNVRPLRGAVVPSRQAHGNASHTDRACTNGAIQQKRSAERVCVYRTRTAEPCQPMVLLQKHQMRTRSSIRASRCPRTALCRVLVARSFPTPCRINGTTSVHHQQLFQRHACIRAVRKQTHRWQYECVCERLFTHLAEVAGWSAAQYVGTVGAAVVWAPAPFREPGVVFASTAHIHMVTFGRTDDVYNACCACHAQY